MNMNNQEERPKSPEPESKEEHPVWEVTLDNSGNIKNGLPKGISPEDVITFKGNDGKWYAQNPTPELLRERGFYITNY